jgi:hypothetical protein
MQFESKSRQQSLPAEAVSTFSGQIKLTICRRLTTNWPDLADYFEIPQHDRARFERGREPQGVWEWLEQRGKLAFLSDGLSAIGRNDLAKELTPNPR